MGKIHTKKPIVGQKKGKTSNIIQFSKQNQKNSKTKKPEKKNIQAQINEENQQKLNKQRSLLNKFANERSSSSDDENEYIRDEDQESMDEFDTKELLELERKYMEAIENESASISQEKEHKNKDATSSNIPKNTQTQKIFEFSNSVKRKFSRSLLHILNTEVPSLEERYLAIEEELRPLISPQFTLLCHAKKSELKWIEDALTEIHAAKRKTSRSRETSLLQQLNYTEVSHLTFEREAKLLKTAQAGIVKLLNAVANVKKDKIEKEIEQKERTDAHIDGDKAYELLKKDHFSYRIPDSVKILKKPL